jgi:hypothetical protein
MVGFQMGLFDSLFNRRDRKIEELMTPLLAMELQEFVVADDYTVNLKHYFKFRNEEGRDEEFIVNYRRLTPGLTPGLEYLGTHLKREGEFRMLSDSGPWSPAITYLIDHGRRLAASTPPTRRHFASKVSVENPRSPNNWAQLIGEPIRSKEAPLTSVRVTEWQVHHSDTGRDGSPRSAEISRIFHISGMDGSISTVNLRIVCYLERSPFNPAGHIQIHRRLEFILWPFELPQETSFVMLLYSMDRSQGGTFDVVAAPLEADPGIAVIAKYGGKDDVENCLDAILSGKDMSFMLSNRTQTPIKCFLPNDNDFKERHDYICSRFAEIETGELVEAGQTKNKSKIINDCAELVRGNPKDHAIWMYEQTPGEFGVLLIKLDTEGKMADAWGLAAFASRSEQGAFALEVARELQIQLMDVVPN